MAEVNGIAAVGGGMTAGGYAAYQTGNIARHTEVKPEQSRMDHPESGKAAERKAPEREDVIAISRDGDTVQAGKEALQQLRDEEELGRVVEKGSLLTAKEEETDPAQERRAAEEEEKQEEEQEEAQGRAITSFNGYSDMQLKQLYLDGAISKEDYDGEIENRKSERQGKEQSVQSFLEEGASNVNAQKEEQRSAIEIRNLGSEDASEAPDAQLRAMIMQALDANAIVNQN